MPLPESECPRCQGVLERPLTAPALQFKGAGWYVNDYAPKAAASSSDTNASDTKAALASDGKGDTKTATSDAPTKPAASSESTSSSASSDSAAKSTTPSPST